MLPSAKPPKVAGDDGGEGDGGEGEDFFGDGELSAYPVQVIVRAVQLSYLMHNPDDTAQIIRIAASFALAEGEYRDFCAKLDCGAIAVPSKSTIYKARTKLDWMCMLWQRRLFKAAVGSSSGQVWCSHFCGDSSPQKTFDYLNTVEDRFVVSGTAADIAQEIWTPGSSAQFCKWDRRTLPVTVLGSGNTGLASKLERTYHQIALETGADLIDARRDSCRTWLADQGVDLSIGDSPCFSGDVVDVLSKLRRGELQWDGQAVIGNFFQECIYHF